MFRRFLEYSLRHGRPVRLLWTQGDEMKSGNVTVVALTDADVSFTTAKNRTKPATLPLSCVLGASYARGDDGSLDGAEGT